AEVGRRALPSSGLATWWIRAKQQIAWPGTPEQRRARAGNAKTGCEHGATMAAVKGEAHHDGPEIGWVPNDDVPEIGFRYRLQKAQTRNALFNAPIMP